MPVSLQNLADEFCHAFYEKQWPSEEAPAVTDLSLSEAYQVQKLVSERREVRGERVVGYKVGCTSAAIREQFGLKEPIYGRLFFPHTTTEHLPIDWREYANCAIEPEMVLHIATELGEPNLPDDALIKAIDYVSPGIELHHFKFWRMPPTTQELICSGGIHAGVIVGKAKVPASQLDFRHEMFSVLRDGVEVTAAPASEIMGGPLHSLRWLVNALTRQGLSLPAGSLVIPGSPVELVAIDSDVEVRIEIEGVGGLDVSFRRAN